jgi:hypothetical protein
LADKFSTLIVQSTMERNQRTDKGMLSEPHDDARAELEIVLRVVA